MRHALMSNFCPSCGSALLGDVHKSRLNIFKQKLANQGFAEKLSTEDIFDIALFMLVEFFPPTIADDADKDTSEESEEEIASNEDVQDSEEQDEDYEAIRSKIREEMLKSQPEVAEVSLDEDLKIERLKRLAKESAIKPSRTVVRRVGS
jgi:hypothetical protein